MDSMHGIYVNTLIRSWVLLCNPIVELGMLRVVDIGYSILISIILAFSELLISAGNRCEDIYCTLIYPSSGFGT